MSNYPPDPGGIFESDAHRHLAGHLPAPSEDPVSLAALVERVHADPVLALVDESGLVLLLEHLANSGHTKGSKSNSLWRQTDSGSEALSGPIANEPPPLKGAALKAAEEADAELRAVEEQVVAEAKKQRAIELRAELEEVGADV
jgi:hypothetical protein